MEKRARVKKKRGRVIGNKGVGQRNRLGNLGAHEWTDGGRPPAQGQLLGVLSAVPWRGNPVGRRPLASAEPKGGRHTRNMGSHELACFRAAGNAGDPEGEGAPNSKNPNPSRWPLRGESLPAWRRR